jgi:hypothetical protein
MMRIVVRLVMWPHHMVAGRHDFKASVLSGVRIDGDNDG